MCCNGLRIILMFTLAVLAFTFNSFIPSIPVILWYLISINVFTFLLYSIDKYYAMKERKRVPEMTLYFFSFAGGFLGAILSMILTKHKLRKKLFISIQAVITIIWLVCIYLVLNNFETIQKALH